MKPLLAGVDIGGSKVAVLVRMRDDGNADIPHSELRIPHSDVLGSVTVPVDLRSPDDTLSCIVEAVSKGVAMAGASTADLAVVGVGVPGRVEPGTGVVRSAVNLGWHEVPLGEVLTARLGVPCRVENDARLAAVGIHRYLANTASVQPDMAYVGVGTGIAAGLILNGRLYRGAHGLAGEIGHMVVAPDGPLCRCGARGCLEALAAGPAIASLGEKAAAGDPQTVLREYRPVTTAAVYQAAREGDAAAQEIAHKVGAHLALALQQLIVAYDVGSIWLGGGVSRNGDAFLQPILSELAHLRRGSLLTREMLAPDMIRLVPPDYDAGAWGALALAEGVV